MEIAQGTVTSSWKFIRNVVVDVPIRIASEVVFQILPKFLLPLAVFVIYVLFCFISSPLLFHLLRFWILPTTLVDEVVFFDYSLSPPTAKINLLSPYKQWSYLKDGSIDHSQASSLGSRRFLTAGAFYAIDINVKLSKSPRNYDLGRFMLRVRIFDESGEAIAEAYRPVVMPYQSPTSLLLENIALYPYRFLGFKSAVESADIKVNVMNEFLEPLVPDPASEHVEISIVSNATSDILRVSMTMMPALYGIAYLLYHYPYSSFVIGSSGVLALQLLGSIIALLFYISLRAGRVPGGEEALPESEVEDTTKDNNDTTWRWRSALRDSAEAGASDASRNNARLPKTSASPPSSPSAMSQAASKIGLRDYAAASVAAYVEETSEEDESQWSSPPGSSCGGLVSPDVDVSEPPATTKIKPKLNPSPNPNTNLRSSLWIARGAPTEGTYGPEDPSLERDDDEDEGVDSDRAVWVDSYGSAVGAASSSSSSSSADSHASEPLLGQKAGEAGAVTAQENQETETVDESESEFESGFESMGLRHRVQGGGREFFTAR